MLVVVAPEHHEVLGGRGSALVRCCCVGDASASPSAGMTATASNFLYCRRWAAAERGRLRPSRRGVHCLSASKARRRRPTGFALHARARRPRPRAACLRWTSNIEEAKSWSFDVARVFAKGGVPLVFAGWEPPRVVPFAGGMIRLLCHGDL